MKKTKKRIEKTLKWIDIYGGWWYLICTPDSKYITPSLMETVLKRLMKDSLYELVFVTIMVHRDAYFMNDVSKKELERFLCEELKIKKKLAKRFIKRLDVSFEEV